MYSLIILKTKNHLGKLTISCCYCNLLTPPDGHQHGGPRSADGQGGRFGHEGHSCCSWKIVFIFNLFPPKRKLSLWHLCIGTFGLKCQVPLHWGWPWRKCWEATAARAESLCSECRIWAQSALHRRLVTEQLSKATSSSSFQDHFFSMGKSSTIHYIFNVKISLSAPDVAKLFQR